MISTLAFILLCVACVIQIIFLIKNRKPDPFSHYIVILASALLFYTIIDRSIKINFVAITNTFESLVFYAGVISLVLFIYRIKNKDQTLPLIIFGGTVITIILLAIASSPIAPKEVLPPVPALQSAWLVLHVSFAFIGEAFFAISFVAAIYYLFVKDKDKQKNIDRIIYTSIAIGFPIYTAGALIFGAIWAQYAWGSFWSWDPKETWSLITWLTYTVYLHTRFIKKLKGKPSAIFAIIGFVFTIFTYFGVNFLLSGLHSYG